MAPLLGLFGNKSLFGGSTFQFPPKRNRNTFQFPPRQDESSLSNVPMPNMSTPQGPAFAPPPVQGVGLQSPINRSLSLRPTPTPTPPPAPVVPQIAGTVTAPSAVQAPPQQPVSSESGTFQDILRSLPGTSPGTPPLPSVTSPGAPIFNPATGLYEGFNQNKTTKLDTGRTGPDGLPIYDVFQGDQLIKDPNDPRLQGIHIPDLPDREGGAPEGFVSKFQAPKTLIERLTELQEQRTGKLSPTERERELTTQLSQVDIEGRRRQSAEEGRGAQIGAVRGEQGRIAEAARLDKIALSSELQALKGIRKEEADALADQMLFEEKVEGLKPKPSEQQTVKEGETIIKWNPTTGQFETLFNAPRKPSSSFNEYLDAVGSGYTSSFMQYQMDLAEFKSSSGSGTGNPSRILSVTEAQDLGVPYGTTEGEAYGTSTTQDQAEIYSEEKALRTISEVDALLEDAEANRGIFGRSAAAPIPDFLRGDAFRNFKADLQTLASNIAFNELTAMRQASKTGGALGQVSERELALLQSTLGAFDMQQSAENIINNLEKIKSSVQRFRDATKQQGGGGSWTDPVTGQTYDFNQGGGGTPIASRMRTDRHNNPTAFTTDVARQAGLREGIDYVAGDPFPGNPSLRTAKLLGDPVAQTIKAIDRIGFHTQGGQQRWTHTAMSPQQWANMSYNQKKNTVKNMYQREGNKGALNRFFA